jgi:hypothetical protein
MDELNDDPLMGLPELRKVLHLSPSGERRMRSEEQDWPPHITIGRRIFYFRASVRDFLARRLAAQAGVDPAAVVVAGLGDPIWRPVDLDATDDQGDGHD